MWDQVTWWLVGGVAILFTAVSLVGLRDRVVAVFIGDAAATILWIVWAINAFAIKKLTDSGVEIVLNYPEFGYLGLVLAAVVTLDLFMAVFEAVGFGLTGDDTNAT